MLLEHLVDEVERAEARGLRAQDGAAPFHALAREHALELVGQLLVLAKEIAYLPAANADVARRHVLVGTYILVELLHESLAETHHLVG